MAEFRPNEDIGAALVEAIRRIRALEARLNQPRTRLLVEDWVITQDGDGDLIMRNEITGTTHTFPN